MGNRATITFAPFRKTAPAIYVHWNGGRASVEAFCKAARELGYRDPHHDDSYAFARLVGLLAVYFGIDDSTSLGVGAVKDLIHAGDDNGCYVIGADWEVVERRNTRGEVFDMSADELEYDVGIMAANIVADVRAAAKGVQTLRAERRKAMEIAQ